MGLIKDGLLQEKACEPDYVKRYLSNSAALQKLNMGVYEADSFGTNE